jgi:hypothetical protein
MARRKKHTAEQIVKALTLREANLKATEPSSRERKRHRPGKTKRES